MLLRNIFEFIVASPVVSTSTVVSLSCAGILAVKVTSPSDSYDSELPAAGSDRALHQVLSNSHSSDFVSHGARSLKDNDLQDSPFNNRAGNRSGNHSLSNIRGNGTATGSQAGVKQAYVNQRYYNPESSTLEEDYYSSDQGADNPAFSFYSGNSNSSNSSPINNSGNTSDNSENNSNDTFITTDTTEGDFKNDVPIDSETGLPQSEYPVTLSHEVKIDLDETQYISCRPVVADGPPCLCEYKMVDTSTNSSFEQTINSCS